MSSAKPYKAAELGGVLSEWEQGGKPRFVSDRLRATVEALEAAERDLARIYDAMGLGKLGEQDRSPEGVEGYVVVQRNAIRLTSERAVTQVTEAWWDGFSLGREFRVDDEDTEAAKAAVMKRLAPIIAKALRGGR